VMITFDGWDDDAGKGILDALELVDGTIGESIVESQRSMPMIL
jgi:hypothetical protein